MTETELVQLLQRHDELVESCLSGEISLEEFLKLYDNFPHSYALDGHESDEEEKRLLDRYRSRVQYHFGVVDALNGLCREEDAAKPEYLRARRFGPAEGLRRLRQFAAQRRNDG